MAQVRETWVIGRPLSLAQALSCACAVAQVLLRGGAGAVARRHRAGRAARRPTATKASQPRKRRRYWPLKPPSREPRLASSSSRPTWSSAGQSAEELAEAAVLGRRSRSRTSHCRAPTLIFCGLRTMRLSRGELLPELGRLEQQPLGIEAEEGLLEARPLLVDHAPHEAGREDALRHLRQHAVVAAAWPAPCCWASWAAGTPAPCRRPCAWRRARGCDLKETFAIAATPASRRRSRTRSP